MSQFINATQVLTAIALVKYDVVVAHDAAYHVGQTLNATYGALSTMTDMVMTALPDQKVEMTAQKGILAASYLSLIDTYSYGAN